MQFNSSQVSFFNGMLDLSNPSASAMCFLDRTGQLLKMRSDHRINEGAVRLLIQAYNQETADVIHASQIQNRMGFEIYTTLRFLDEDTFEFHAFSINKYENSLGFTPSHSALAWAHKALESQSSLYVCDKPQQTTTEKDRVINPEDVRLIAKVSKVVEQPYWHEVWLQCTFGPQSGYLRNALEAGSGFRISPIGLAQVYQRRCLRKHILELDIFDQVTSCPVIFRDITDICRLVIHPI